ncbi:hypothetical protein [Nocardiopsis alba]
MQRFPWALNPRKPDNAYVRKRGSDAEPHLLAPPPADGRARLCHLHAPSCRERRAERLPCLGCHRSEYAGEHTQAAHIQARYRHLVIWWGEATRSFWAATPNGR